MMFEPEYAMSYWFTFHPPLARRSPLLDRHLRPGREGRLALGAQPGRQAPGLDLLVGRDPRPDLHHAHPQSDARLRPHTRDARPDGAAGNRLESAEPRRDRGTGRAADSGAARARRLE